MSLLERVALHEWQKWFVPGYGQRVGKRNRHKRRRVPSSTRTKGRLNRTLRRAMGRTQPVYGLTASAYFIDESAFLQVRGVRQ